MPPGSEIEFEDPKRLRSSPTERVTRSSRLPDALAQNPVFTPISPPKRSNQQAQKRKGESRSRPTKRASYPISNGVIVKHEPEDVQNVYPIARSRSESYHSPHSVSRVRKRRRSVHPSTEVYSKNLYRAVACGDDVDYESELDAIEMTMQAPICENWKPEYSAGTQVLANQEALPFPETCSDLHIIRVMKRRTGYVPESERNQKIEALRHKRPVVVKVKSPVQYEITFSDTRFIDILNFERRPKNRCYITSTMFCRIVETLEIATYRRIHDYILDTLHAVYLHLPDDELGGAECDICRLVDCSPEDFMIFCDMCNTCVHNVCFGMDKNPEANEPWKCPKCTHTGTPAPPCCLCPALGGSMTYNVEKTQWAHHVCALYMPEIIFDDEERRAPMSQYQNVPPERFDQICRICDTNLGACITCSYPGCDVTHHVGCALRAGLTVDIHEIGDIEGNIIRRTFCHLHTPNFVFDDRFTQHYSPWLAKMESVFFLMTECDKVANVMKIEECIVSDVYEYWKMKRLQTGNRALIRHLRDYVEIEPTILRTAARIEAGLNHKLTSREFPCSPSSSSSAHSAAFKTQPPHYFFRRAALMVTEYRQHSLKRVRSTIQWDQRMLAMVVERDQRKRELVRIESDAMAVETEMAKRGMAAEVLKAWNVSAEEIRRATDPDVFAKAMADWGPPSTSSSQNHKRAAPSTHPHQSPARKKISPRNQQATVSPLRPLNLPNRNPMALHGAVAEDHRRRHSSAAEPAMRTSTRLLSRTTTAIQTRMLPIGSNPTRHHLHRQAATSSEPRTPRSRNLIILDTPPTTPVIITLTSSESEESESESDSESESEDYILDEEDEEEER